METGSKAEIEFMEAITEANNIPTENVPGGAREAEDELLPTTFDMELLEAFLSAEKPDEPSSPVKKKRGRPKKIPGSKVQKLKLPTRVSTRLRKCPTRANCDEREDKEGPKQKKRRRKFWSRQEKRQLLKGLTEVGTDNVLELQKNFLPGRTEAEVKSQIIMWQEFAQMDVMTKLLTEKRVQESATVNCVSKLDQWLHHMEQAKPDGQQLFALSNVFLLIAEYAELPLPELCGGLDFRAMYRWLHCMLNGLPYYGLNMETAAVLNDSVSHMFSILREKQELTRLQPQLLSLPRQRRMRTYSRPIKRSSKPVTRIDSLFNLPAMNPLRIPPDQLHKPFEQSVLPTNNSQKT